VRCGSVRHNEPEDFVARLAALVPKPRAHLTRYHGVFAPASPDRAEVVPRTATERGEVSVSDRQRAMSWAQRLKRVFAIDIETCQRCGGRLRVIASIEQPALIEPLLDHLRHAAEPVDPAHSSHPSRLQLAPTVSLLTQWPLIRTIRRTIRVCSGEHAVETTGNTERRTGLDQRRYFLTMCSRIQGSIFSNEQSLPSSIPTMNRSPSSAVRTSFHPFRRRNTSVAK